MHTFKKTYYIEEIQVGIPLYAFFLCLYYYSIYIYTFIRLLYESHEENIRSNSLTMTHPAGKQPLRTRPLFSLTRSPG